LHEWLRENDVPGISGIDTRQLTKKLRMHGVMLGTITHDPEKVHKMDDPNKRDLVSEVTTKVVKEYGSGKTIVLIDGGVKNNIIRSLSARFHVVQVPASYSVDKIMSYKPSGIVISNGPGDPKNVPYMIKTTKSLIEYKLPIFGICLGNQILGLALGYDTYKMKFGHRGQNHPCMDSNGKCYITSQNHGYAVDVKENVRFTNINDKTVEGIQHKKLPLLGVQFHPEASPGPYDTSFLFDEFQEMVKNAKI
jgi:carbamoyl-phosphate synthase small subunit